MQLTVTVKPHTAGRFAAAILGAPEVSADGATADAAVAALEAELDRRYRAGELRLIQFPKVSLSDLAGTYTGDAAENLREIVAEAYRLRDAQKAEEFPE
jgi:hypothetical protein